MNELKKELKREIGVWGLSSNIVNIMLGAGIFVLPAIVAEGLGSASILAYLFCGVLISLVMLCFAEVGSKVTTDGGVYAYIKAAFGNYFGFLTSILFLLAAISADAAIANAVADIIGEFYTPLQNQLIRVIFFFILFAGLGYINVIGVKTGIQFVKVITAAKLIPLLLLVFIGMKDISFSLLSWETMPSIEGIGEISLILFFAFQGGEGGLSVSGEVKNPQKTIPRAILLSILGLLILYILIQIISQGILGSALPTFKENPLGETAGQIFGPIGFTIMTVAAAVSIFGGLSSEVLSMPRVLFGAANDDVIPIKFLNSIHTKYATPFISIIAYAGLDFLFASVGGFKQLAIISSASILFIYLGVALAVIKLRRTEKVNSQSKSFRIPGGYIVPVLSVLVILWFLSSLTQNELLGIGLFIIFLTVVYYLMNFKMIKKQ